MFQSQNASVMLVSTVKAGGHSPSAPSTGSQRQESGGGDVSALGRVLKPRPLEVFSLLNPWMNPGPASPQQSTETLLLLSSRFEGSIPTEWCEAQSGTMFEVNAPFFSPHPVIWPSPGSSVCPIGMTAGPQPSAPGVCARAWAHSCSRFGFYSS